MTRNLYIIGTSLCLAIFTNHTLASPAHATTAVSNSYTAQDKKDRAKGRQDRRQNARQDRRVDRRVDNRVDRRVDRRIDRRHYNRHHVIKHNHTHRIGFHVNLLPRAHVTLTLRGSRYYYASGVYYRRAGTGYVVVAAPIGAHVAALPFGYVDFHLGPRRYYYVNRTYYVYEPATTRYIVVEKPEGANETELQKQAETGPTAKDKDNRDFVIYPAKGQTKEQQNRDQYECHRWSVQESGFDPVTSNNDKGKAIYLRAIKACMTGRGYSLN